MTIPAHEPKFYWRIADAAYAKDPAHYVEEHLNDIDYVEGSRIGDWRIRLFRDNSNQSLIASFRGTQWSNARNWFDNIGHILIDPKKLHRRMKKKLAAWSEKYQLPICAYVGHSAGGFHAVRVNRKVKEIFRITFNAHKAKSGEHNWNFRTKDDSVSKHWLSGSKPYRYITVGNGGHPLNDFKPLMRNVLWDKDTKYV
ncbi:MAG: hypothetical protein CMO81_06975 [Waddliaceae bacterium]|nr:hypothetical protein [Waddliaceae bacterium]